VSGRARGWRSACPATITVVAPAIAGGSVAGGMGLGVYDWDGDAKGHRGQFTVNGDCQPVIDAGRLTGP
jgi:hypothetical protein